MIKLGVLKLELVGGEPLLHPDIEEIIRYSKSKGITVSISTNSFLLNDSMINKLTKAGLDVIQISVDRKTPSQITQKSLDKIAPKIEKLKKTDIKIHISGVICEDTMDEIEDVLRYGLKLEDLVKYNYKKDCQSSCGIYCAISNSMFVQNPIRFVAAEIPSKIKQNFRFFFAKRYSEERP